MHLDELDQALNSEVGERQDPVFDAMDPDDTVLDFHFIGDVPQPILVFSEISGDLGDGRDVMDLVDVGGPAARTEIADAGGIQFQGSSSSNRWAGWAAMRERTSLSQAYGSTPFILAVTIRLHIEAARFDRIRKTATTFFLGRSPAALARRHCWTGIRAHPEGTE